LFGSVGFGEGGEERGPVDVAGFFAEANDDEFFGGVYVDVLAEDSPGGEVAVGCGEPPLVFVVGYAAVGGVGGEGLCDPLLGYELPAVPVAVVHVEAAYFGEVACPGIDAAECFFDAVVLAVETP